MFPQHLLQVSFHICLLTDASVRQGVVSVFLTHFYIDTMNTFWVNFGIGWAIIKDSTAVIN